MSTITAAENAAMTMLTRLDHLVRSSRIYPDGHANLTYASHAIGEEFERMLDGADSTTVFIIEDRLLIDNRLIRAAPGVRSAVRELGTFWSLRGVGGLTLTAHAREDQVQPFVRLLLEFPGDGGPGPDTLNRELHQRGIRGLSLLAPRSAVGTEDVGGSADPAMATLRLYLRAIRCADALQKAPINPALRVEVARLAHELVDVYLTAPRRALALLGPKELVGSHLTHPAHCAVYAAAAGQALGFDRTSLEQLVQCALVLAVGLEPEDDDEEAPRRSPPSAEGATTASRPMDISDGILHTRATLHLIADGDLGPLALRMLRATFEHDLGVTNAGPPGPLRWPDQHPFTPILCAASALDRLRSGHATGKRYSPARALEKMRDETHRYHPEVLTALETLLPELEVVSAYV
jgi:hypothetical protein